MPVLNLLCKRSIHHGTVDTIDIVDAFICSGRRFGLNDKRVFVEVCRYASFHRRYWADIYYFTNPDQFVARIDITQQEVSFDGATILAYAKIVAEYQARQAAQERIQNLDDLLATRRGSDREILQHYAGGQLEIMREEDNRILYCTIGQIDSVQIDQHYLIVKYAWIATLNVSDNTWQMNPQGGHEANIRFKALPYEHLGRGSIMFTNLATSERMRLFHPNDPNKLNPRDIQGFPTIS